MSATGSIDLRARALSPVTLLLLVAVTFVLMPLFASLALAAPKKKDPDPTGMNFIVVRAQYCESNCPEWISAEGDITAESAKRLKKILKSLGKRKLPIIINSDGGDVQAAFAMGRLIRKHGLDTMVASTRLKGCRPKESFCKEAIPKQGPPIGMAVVFTGRCASACPLMLAGGVRRFGDARAQLGVHQITTITQNYRVQYEIRYKMVKGKKKEVSRKVVGRKYEGKTVSTALGKKARAELSGYLREMGVTNALIPLIESTPAAELRYLTPAEALNMHLLTEITDGRRSAIDILCEPDATGPVLPRCGMLPKLQVSTVATQVEPAPQTVRN